MNKLFAMALACTLLIAAFLCEPIQANGGGLAFVQQPVAVARVRTPFFRPRVAIVRQPIVVQQAFVQPFLRQRFVAPLAVPQQFVFPQAYVQSQAFFQPQAFSQQFFTQSYVQPQAFIAPQIQSFSTGCPSAAFFR